MLALALPWTYLPLVFASVGLGIFYVSSMAYLNECVRDALKATVSGSYYLAWGLGYFLGPLAVARLGAMVGSDAGFYVLAVLFAGQTVVLSRAFGPHGSSNYR